MHTALITVHIVAGALSLVTGVVALYAAGIVVTAPTGTLTTETA